ncbi:MAG: hypothetical protein BA874_07510 [Desulfuromonadales bacterium C00003068]|nr:MAG: hypothetical protein BA874_07510 [Desulfuromonadales bacterium C00003068]
MNKITFGIKISAQEYLKSYQISGCLVSIVADDGRSLKLPAKHLRPFLTHTGILGRFELTFDGNTLVSLKRLA